MVQRLISVLLFIWLVGCGPTPEDYIDEVIRTDLGIVDLEYDVVSYEFVGYERGSGGVVQFEIRAGRVITEVVDLCDELHEFTESGNLGVAGCEVRTGEGEVVEIVYTASDSSLFVTKQELD